MFTRGIVRLCAATHSTCDYQDNQDEQDDPAEAPTHRRPTEVQAASAEQQQQNYQQND
jgi:hypothetical protein